ncbi:MAG: hypothetical protein H6819_09450 [Phycisphaerales bacterium]|nr:hypothetical protein [Phycisphaerales bacterium]MCB9855423.1 hypothetical protein [Phycisphaerales bacterium]
MTQSDCCPRAADMHFNLRQPAVCLQRATDALRACMRTDVDARIVQRYRRTAIAGAMCVALQVTFYSILLADDEPREPMVDIEVASIRIESLQYPEITVAPDLRQYYVVDYRVRNVGSDPIWFHWADPYFRGKGRFQQHAARFPFDSEDTLTGVQAEEIPAEKTLQFTSRYPLLAGHRRYRVEFAVAGPLPKSISESMQTLSPMMSWRHVDKSRDDVVESIHRSFRPRRVTINLPESAGITSPLSIHRISVDPVGEEDYMTRDGKRDTRPECFKSTYRFTNRSERPVFLIVSKPDGFWNFRDPMDTGMTFDATLGLLDLRWSDSIICIISLPTIHFIEIAGTETEDMSFFLPNHPAISTFAFAANLTPEETRTLKSYEGHHARREERTWIIGHTTAVWVDHDAETLVEPVKRDSH